MPPALLVPVVVISIALIGAVTWLLGWSALAELDAETARVRFLQDFPEARIESVSVATDRLSALLWLGTEAGLVFTVGARFATRKLGRARIVPVADGLRIEFAEVAARRVCVALDENALSIWRERLDA